MEDYVLDFIPDAVRRVQKDSGVEDVTLLGYCLAECCRCYTDRSFITDQ
jgi:hypothetical protein